MSCVIDCDGVFEILTQAPFPTGGPNDDDIENHLRVCHDCRCLAEALRPAVGLIHESLANDEQLPRYDGRLVEKIARKAVDSRRAKHWAALFAAGLAACLLTWLNYSGAHRRGGSSLGESRQSVLAAPDTAGMATLCSLELPNSCFQSRDRRAISLLVVEVAAKPVINASDLDFSCCTQCHRFGGTGPASARALRALDAACAACHRPSATATAIDLRTWTRSVAAFKSVG